MEGMYAFPRQIEMIGYLGHFISTKPLSVVRS